MINRGARGVQAAIVALAAAGALVVVGEAGAENQAEFTIGVEDEGGALTFVPTDVTISRGDTVTFDFTGSTVPHNASSTNASEADPEWEAWKTPFAASGRFSREFPQLGVYEFVCEVHPVMTGKITVIDAPVATPERTPRPLTTPTPVATVAAATPTPDHSRDTPAPTAKAGADKTAPALSNVTARRSGRGARVKWTVSEPASLTLRFTKSGSTRVLRTVRLQGRPGTSAVTVRGSKLNRGRYAVRIEARDAAGNRGSAATTVRLGR